MKDLETGFWCWQIVHWYNTKWIKNPGLCGMGLLGKAPRDWSHTSQEFGDELIKFSWRAPGDEQIKFSLGYRTVSVTEDS